MPRSSRSCNHFRLLPTKYNRDPVLITSRFKRCGMYHSLYENDLIEVRGAPNYSIDDVVTDKKADEKKVEEQKSVEDDYRSEDDGEDEEITEHETSEESNDESDSNEGSDNSSGDDSDLESYSLHCNILEPH